MVFGHTLWILRTAESTGALGIITGATVFIFFNQFNSFIFKQT